MLEKIFGGTNRGTNTGSNSSTKEELPVAKFTAEIEAEFDRYDRIFRASRGYAFLDWDLNSGKIYWKGGLLSYLGYDGHTIPKEASADEFIRFIYPDDIDGFIESIRHLVTDEDHSGNIICRGLKVDGSLVWVELRLDAIRGKDGLVTHLSGLMSDISPLKAAEEALKDSEARHTRILQGANDGMWEWCVGDKDKVAAVSDESLHWSVKAGNFILSQRCWEMLGFEPDDAIVSGGLVAWRNLIHPDDGKRYDQTLIEHAALEEPFDIEYRLRAKDGSWRWIRSRGQAYVDDVDGSSTILTGTNMDITELKRAEEYVNKAKEEAEAANQAKSDFLSSMSHELRTPLNAIMGFAQIFELDLTINSEQLSNIQEILSAGHHLVELVGDVLDLAKIEGGQLRLSLGPVFPLRVLNECVILLKSQYEKRNLLLEIEWNGLEAQMILADSVRLKQVLLNLMGNAGKYNKVAGHIRVECTLVDDTRMRICVADTGLGIPAQLQSQLFQSFNRLGAEHSGIEGTGIGLVITKQLVEQMGGSIGFSSRENEGSQFWVEFPLTERSERMVLPSHHQFLRDANTEIPPLEVKVRKKVLYVEDNLSNQKLMQKFINRYPILDLSVTGMAVQGLFLARSSIPDLIILDVNLPEVSGYELLKILKSDAVTENIPVVALSANVISHDIEKGKKAGFDCYLTKPLNFAQLITTFNSLFHEG